MDALVQLSRDLQKAKNAGLLRVSSSPSIYVDSTNKRVSVTVLEFTKTPTENQVTRLYSYLKGCYTNILLDLRAFVDIKHGQMCRIEIITKDDPLKLHQQDK